MTEVTGIVIIIGLFVVFVLDVYLIVMQRKQGASTIGPEIQKLHDQFLTLETALKGKLESLPEVINMGTADTVQRRFATFSDSMMEKNQNMIQKFGEFQNNLTKSLGDSSRTLSQDFNNFKDLFRKSVTQDFDKLIKSVETKLDHIDKRVQENLSDGFKKTNETFHNVIQRLAKIDEAQKKIESLSSNVVSLQDILTDKKSRGIFGEVQLNQILYAVFGEKNEKVFRTQHKLSNGNIVDAMIFAPDPTGNVAVDSKFPLDNFKKMKDKSLSETERNQAARLFQSDVKKHIDDIAKKYIISGETSNQAVLFLPAEAVFAELHAYYEGLVNYAYRKRVWITSPTTFMAVLNTLQIVLYDMERKKYANIIQQQIVKLSEEFRRYRDRWDKLSTHIDTVQKDVKDIHVTTRKITSSFDKIAHVELEEEGLPEDDQKSPKLIPDKKVDS